MSQGGVVTTRRTVAGVMLQTITGTTATNHYLFHDHLGSLVRVTNASGTPINSQDYSAFGERRDYDTPTSSTSSAPAITTRGFTGHEMVDGLGVIHMNGHIYDPLIGRFLQPDPVIQAPENLQSWNAYTYVFNNPLSYTDPTGMIGIKERQAAAVIVGIVAAVFGQYYITQGAYTAAFLVTAGGAFVSGAIATQSLRGGIQAAFGAALTLGVSAGIGGWEAWQQIAAQAVTGGIVEVLQGGQFGHGFASAGLTAAFMPHVGHIRNNVGRTVVGALVGGTISEATGGKFANGALSGAIQAALVDRSAAEDRMTGAQVSTTDSDAVPAYITEIMWADKDPFGMPRPFKTQADALLAVEGAIAGNGWSSAWEYGGYVIPVTGGFIATSPVTSLSDHALDIRFARGVLPRDAGLNLDRSTWLAYHGHPDFGISSQYFSPQDVSFSESTRMRSVLFAPGTRRVYDPVLMNPQTHVINGRPYVGVSLGLEF